MDVDRQAELFQLDRATCVTLLATQHVGRLVIGGDDPEVIPLNYRSVDGVITFRTQAESRAGRSAGEPVVFEVDMFDERTRSGWSVIVRGRLRPASGDDAQLDVDTWAPEPRDEWMVLSADSLTGRLLRGAVGGETHPAHGYL